MLHPVGPLPASLYWRRRAVAFAGVVVLLLLGWAILPGGGGDQLRDTAAAAGSQSPSPTVPAAAPTSLTATAPSGDPGRAGDGDGAAAPASAAAPSPTPKPTPAPQPPKACADTALRLAVTSARPSWTVGQSPVLRLQVRNVSKVSCVRDLGAALQEIVLYQGSTRLWSSNDCYPQGDRDAQVLRPGAVDTFSVTWSGLSSKKGCQAPRTRVGAGNYQLIGRLGTLVSRRAPITLTAT